MLILCRILQGLGGGGLQPTEQAILADTFTPEQRNMGFAIYGMAIVVAPAVGPTLGGWITDNYSWHWIFFINFPIGLISLFLTQRLIEDPPHLKLRSKQSEGRTDYLGISTIVLGVGFVQLALDKGQELDWLASSLIRAALAIGLTSLGILVWREWRMTNPIINLRLLKNRNFATATIFNFMLGMVLNGSTILIPQFLQEQLGYSAQRAGWALSPGGIALAVLMPVAGIAAAKFDPRKVIAFGFLITSLSLFNMTRVYSTIDFHTIVWLRVLQVIGLPFIFIPITTLSYVGLTSKDHNQVSGISNFVRNVGGAIGVSFLITFLARTQQASRAEMVSHLTQGSVFFKNYLNTLTHGSSDQGTTHRALAQIQAMVDGQAHTLAFVNAFFFLSIAIALLAPLPFLMKRPSKKDLEMSSGMH
jgi:DHA2 family multidrug resistance protein